METYKETVDETVGVDVTWVESEGIGGFNLQKQ